MKILTRGADLRALSRRARQGGETAGFVPTMGSLHEGHLSLIRRARREHDRVIVSVFVNPLQFGPREDYAHYPRDEVRDVRMCRDEGCDWFFLPRARVLYPPGCSTRVAPGPLASRWEGAVRPGHFQGVATVVLKLLNFAEPDVLYLGQKDYQQAQVLRAMVRDLDLPCRIVVAPTVRERDGLALSSRNVRLDPEQRLRASGLIRSLREGREAARSGIADARPLLERVRRCLVREARPDGIDYVALVDPSTLEPLARLTRRAILIAAIRIGRTRLIDNLFVAAPRRTRRGAGSRA